jgi:dTDP-glucose 4,6-dehydratase
VLRLGKNGEIYNIGAGNELTNMEITIMIRHHLDRSENLIEHVKDRPGHDFRYSLDSNKIRSLGCKPKAKFEEALKETIQWYKENKWRWESLIMERS